MGDPVAVTDPFGDRDFELLGAIGLLMPRTAALAAIGLILIMSGALFTHITHGEMMMVILPLMVVFLLGIVVYIRHPFGKVGPMAQVE